MALSVTHSSLADATFSATGKTDWEAAHTLTGVASPAQGGTGLDTSGSTGVPVWSAGTATMATGIAQSGGAITTITGTTITGSAFSTGGYLIAAGGIQLTGSGAGSNFIQNLADGSFRFSNGALTQFGTIAIAGVTNSWRFNGNSTGTDTSRTEINKTVTGIADNVATATFTVTIPNTAQSAGGEFILVGSLGAGGAIGANEASATVAYDWVVTRTAGANAVVTFAAAIANPTASVAGAAVITCTAAASAVAGAVGAANTFTVNVTIHAVTGSSTNHTCMAYAKLLNANASGVTIA